jgi:hypothetical protein
LLDAAGNAKPNMRKIKPELKLSPQALALAPQGVDHEQLQRLYTNHMSLYLGDPLNALMNGPIRKKLGVIPDNVTWGGQSDLVFSTLSLDFMKPVYAEVDAALSSGRINVTVEEGQLDLICSNKGADLWMKRLQWPGMADFYASPRQPRYPNAQAKQLGATSGFVKNSGVLTKYDGELWVWGFFLLLSFFLCAGAPPSPLTALCLLTHTPQPHPCAPPIMCFPSAERRAHGARRQWPGRSSHGEGAHWAGLHLNI